VVLFVVVLNMRVKLQLDLIGEDYEQCYTYDRICTIGAYDQTHRSMSQYVGQMMESPP
jgi:hypothetical protein